MSPAERARRRLRALPLRTRLVAGFCVAISLVLLGAGSFVYWRVGYALDLRLDDDLRLEASRVTAALGAGRTPGPALFQVLDPAGRVLSAGPGLGATALLPPAVVRPAADRPVTREVGSLLPASARPLRVLAGPLRLAGQPAVLLVAVRRDQRDEALRELLAQLLLAGIGAVSVSALVGERLAKAALRPVEAYRRQAEAVTAGATGLRLDVPVERSDEVSRLGATLNAMLDALEATVAREKRFTADASHELRTPLTVLSTRVQLALSRERTQAEHEATLRELARDLRDLTSLAEELLSLTSAEGAHPDPVRLPLAELCQVLTSVGRDHGIEPALPAGDLAVGSVTGLAATQLRQVVTNLVRNAELHGAAPVQLGAQVVGDVVCLTVGDQGEGPPPGFVPRAAQRFARADDARDRPGAGLGLALVRALVEPAHGELRLCSGGRHHRYDHRQDLPCGHPGQGTTASVLLPVR